MVNVAILGFGTVGSGVAEVLAKNADHIDQKVETPVRLKYILDVRDFPDSPFGDKVVHDFGVIENDPTVDIVVETIGGATVAPPMVSTTMSTSGSCSMTEKSFTKQSR